MSEIIAGPDNYILDFHIHNRYDNGWHFGAGDPEFWKLSDRMLVPGGKLLDLGIGEARASLYFGLNGMSIVGVENNPRYIESLNLMAGDLAEAIPFDVSVIESNVFNVTLPENTFDTILISQLVHVESKQKAYDLFDKALKSLKPGGHIWVRAAGKESSAFEELSWDASKSYSQSGARFQDRDVIVHACTCSGDWKMEPTLFFDPLDLHAYFAERGAKVVHSQTIPTNDKMNIMYGEDYNTDQYIDRGGMVTVLAQKPE